MRRPTWLVHRKKTHLNNQKMNTTLFLQQLAADAPPPPAVHHIVRSSLDDQRPNGRIVGASLLCFAIDPLWSRLYFLLGKERKNVHWRAGSEKWSDFGGRAEQESPEAEETAAKEFVEETLAMVRYFEDDVLPRKQYADIAASLRNKNYAFQIKVMFGDASNPRHHVTFIKQLPWDPSAIARFDECRTMLLQPGPHFHTPKWRELVDENPCIIADQHWQVPYKRKHKSTIGNIKINDACLEKKNIGLWSIPQLQKAVENAGVLLKRDGRIERCRSNFTQIIELVISELTFSYPHLIAENNYNNI